MFTARSVRDVAREGVNGIMELYYKDLISADTSLEKLVDDLMFIVQGANELAEAAGATLTPTKRKAIRRRLDEIKQSCLRIRDQVVHGAHATDRLLHKHPYSTIGIAFAGGVLAGFLLKKVRR